MKKAFIIITTIILLLGAGYILLRYKKLNDAEPLLKQKLAEMVKKGSKGLYELKIGDIDFSAFTSNVTLNNINLVTDASVVSQLTKLQQLPNNLYHINIRSLILKGVKLKEIVSGKRIGLHTLHINNPTINVFHLRKDADQKQEADTTSLYERINRYMKEVDIKNLIVESADLLYINKIKSNKTTRIQNVSMSFKNILIDPSTQKDTTRFLFAQDAQFGFKNFQINTSDSLHVIGIDFCSISAIHKNIAIKGFSITPTKSKQEYRHALKYKKDRYNIRIDSIEFKKSDWWGLTAEENVGINAMTLSNGKIEIYSDKSLPFSGKSKVGGYPHQLLMSAEFPILINDIQLKNIDLVYEEYNPKSRQEGAITFNKVNAQLKNVTNRPELININDSLSITASAKLLNQIDVTANFLFPLKKSKQGNFELHALIGRIMGKQLNAVAEPLGLFHIDNGVIHSLAADITGDNYTAKGSVIMKYNNLGITILKRDRKNPGQFKKRELLSLIANSFIIKPSNPREDGRFITAHPLVQRDINRSFFSLIWLTLQEGIKETVKFKDKSTDGDPN